MDSTFDQLNLPDENNKVDPKSNQQTDNQPTSKGSSTDNGIMTSEQKQQILDEIRSNMHAAILLSSARKKRSANVGSAVKSRPPPPKFGTDCTETAEAQKVTTLEDIRANMDAILQMDSVKKPPPKQTLLRVPVTSNTRQAIATVKKSLDFNKEKSTIETKSANQECDENTDNGMMTGEQKQRILDEIRSNMHAAILLSSARKKPSANEKSAYKSRPPPPKFGTNCTDPTPTTEVQKLSTLEDIRANMEAILQMDSVKKPPPKPLLRRIPATSAIKKYDAAPKVNTRQTMFAEPSVKKTLDFISINKEKSSYRSKSANKKCENVSTSRPERPKSHISTLKNTDATMQIGLENKSSRPLRRIPISTSIKKCNRAPKLNMRHTMIPENEQAAKKTLNFSNLNKEKVTNIPRLVHKDDVFKQPVAQPKKTKVTVTKNLNRISGISDLPATPTIPNHTRKIKGKENITSNNVVVGKNKKVYIKPNASVSLRLSISSTADSEISFLRREEEMCENEELIMKASTPFRNYREVCQEITNLSNNCETPTSNTSSDNFEQRISRTTKDVSFYQVETARNKDPFDPKNLNSMREQLMQGIVNLRNIKQNMEEVICAHETLLERVSEYLSNGEIVISKSSDDEDENYIVEKLTGFHIKYGDDNKSELCAQEYRKVSSPRLIPTKKNKHNNLRKQVLHKSMPDSLNEIVKESLTPVRPLDKQKRALSMYMEMKQSLNFLQTPFRNTKKMSAVSTPRLMSLNLMSQLENLYG